MKILFRLHLRRLNLAKSRLKPASELPFERPGFCGGKRSGLQHSILEKLRYRCVRVDSLVQFGLRKAGLVRLVMSVPPVTVHIQDNVTGKSLPELQSKFRHKLDRNGVVSV